MLAGGGRGEVLAGGGRGGVSGEKGGGHFLAFPALKFAINSKLALVGAIDHLTYQEIQKLLRMLARTF
jgi:hypothetical protein